MTNVICLMGPTASGKTALAFSLQDQLPIEIISVDSALIYREMNIGTAKPSPSELIRHPHFLVDILNPDESYSAANFCEQATLLCHEISQRGNIPLLVGGTMMYFRALQQGLSELPPADPVIRFELEQQAARVGWQAMHEQLLQVDPVTAQKLHLNDTQRIQRALEIMIITGRPMSSFLNTDSTSDEFNWLNVVLMPTDRSWLHHRIEARFVSMLAAGFVDEVDYLIKKWQLLPHHPALRCVGYRQAYDYLSGLNTYTEFSQKGVFATRQLAKRQLTWLRTWPDAYQFACDDEGSALKIRSLISEFIN